MLIETIKFEIRDFTTGIANEFLVANTKDNFDLISRHNKTREIEFTEVFDFEFIHKAHSPKFIQFGNAVLQAFDEYSELDIDDIDEMVGIY